jgi:hypothetical protein
MKHRDRTIVLAAVLAVTLVIGSGARAVCTSDGHISAAPNAGDPALGDWVYTFTLTWNTDSQFSLSHFNLFMDDAYANCGCAELADAITFMSPIGSSESDTCTVYYDGFVECEGDPSIGLVGTILKFEPVMDGCEPGPTGTGTFVFYSDYPPASISMPNLFMSDKFAGQSCEGTLTGVFPALPCNPVDAQSSTWGGLKSAYR